MLIFFDNCRGKCYDYCCDGYYVLSLNHRNWESMTTSSSACSASSMSLHCSWLSTLVPDPNPSKILPVLLSPLPLWPRLPSKTLLSLASTQQCTERLACSPPLVVTNPRGLASATKPSLPPTIQARPCYEDCCDTCCVLSLNHRNRDFLFNCPLNVVFVLTLLQTLRPCRCLRRGPSPYTMPLRVSLDEQRFAMISHEGELLRATKSEEVAMLAAGLLPTAADMVGVTGVIHLQAPSLPRTPFPHRHGYRQSDITSIGLKMLRALMDKQLLRCGWVLSLVPSTLRHGRCLPAAPLYHRGALPEPPNQNQFKLFQPPLYYHQRMSGAYPPLLPALLTTASLCSGVGDGCHNSSLDRETLPRAFVDNSSV
nr:unnamed protein product [Digitaria exilis]